MVILPLTLVGASAKMRGKQLVGPIDLTVSVSGLTMVIGSNGAGKTTLLRLMHGLQRCSSGSVEWSVPMEIAQQNQAFVFQTPVMMRRRVVDCLAFPLRLRGLGKAKARAKAQECAAKFGLTDLLESWAPTLSGGEQQKLSLARALIINPQVLFLDEPCANLDGRATSEIEAILTMAQKVGTRIVMSTHNMGQAKRLADDVIFIHKGNVLERAQASEFFNRPQTSQARAFLNGDIVV